MYITYMGRPSIPIDSRLYAKVSKTDDCWLWTGQVQWNRGEYGVIRSANTKKYVHRVAWELEHGEIPVGMTVDHLCENTLCVRVTHLELVSHGENARRQWLRHPPPSTCPKGHQDWGQRKNRNGREGTKRFCKTCNNDRRKASRKTGTS